MFGAIQIGQGGLYCIVAYMREKEEEGFPLSPSSLSELGVVWGKRERVGGRSGNSRSV